MQKRYLILLSLAFLSGCAAKMAYLNTQKPPEEVKKDKGDCQKAVDASDLKDAGLRLKKFNECMKDKEYDVVSEEKALKIQGFGGLWIKPGADLKAYEAVFIDKVDLGDIKVDTQAPGLEVSEEDISNLGKEMFKRFSQAMGYIIPVITDEEKAAGEKVLYIRLKLNKAAQTNIGLNAGLQVVGQFTPSFVPLPDAPLGAFAFEAVIADCADREKLIIVSDECDEDRNASLAGVENFEKWKHAYNIMDYWADHLAALVARERGQKYKSRLGFKLIDF